MTGNDLEEFLRAVRNGEILEHSGRPEASPESDIPETEADGSEP